MTLNDVRNLEPDEVTAIDIQILKENRDNLTEDESLRFAPFLEEKIVAPDPIDDKTPEPQAPPAPEPEAPHVEDKIVLTKEEIKAMIDEAVSSKTPALVTPVPEKVEEAPFVPNDWEPNGWKEVFDKAVEYVSIKNAKITEQAQKEIDSINDSLTKEVDNLRASGESIPAKGTKEYEEFDKKLTATALEYQIPSFTVAYKLMKKLETGAVVPTPSPAPAPAPAPNADNKVVAAKIGGATIETGVAKKEIQYKDIRGKSPRQVADSFLEELE